MLTYALACNTGTFAAIGPDSATQLDKCAAPHPTSVMHIHGTADRLIPYNGGQGAGVEHIDGPAVPDLNAFWRNIDGCAPPATTTDGAVTTSTAGCPDGRNVVLVTVDGGGHVAVAVLRRPLAICEARVTAKMPTVGGVLRADTFARAGLLQLLCNCRENVI